MISVKFQQWLIMMHAVLGMASPQFPMPFPPPYAPAFLPIVPIPPPVPVPVPVAVPIPVGIMMSEDTTTTTSEPKLQNNETLKIFLPWLPINWPVPDALPSNITIPLPDCNLTLKLPPDVPQAIPMPFAIPVPPPVIMIPLPPTMIKRPFTDKTLHPYSSSKSSQSYSSSSSDNSDASDSDSDVSEERSRKKKKKRKRKRRYDIFRSNRRFYNTDSKESIQPILSYVSENSDVKIRRRLSRKDAALLLQSANKSVKNVQVVAGDDSRDRSRVLVVTSPDESSQTEKKLVMRRSLGRLGSGYKKIIFRPPNNKKISNFSVSFKVDR